MRKAVVLVAVLLLVAGLASAQEYKGKARVQGSVTDMQGKPVEGVKVRLVYRAASEGFDVKTNAEGRWTASWIRSGEWDIDFEKPGFMSKKISVVLNELQKNPPIDIQLEKAAGLIATDELKKDLVAANDLFDQGKYAEAIETYKTLISKYPEAYIINNNIGNCYFKLEKYDEAEQWYQKILEKDPTNVEAIISIGNCYANRGQNDKALEWYGKVEFDKIKDPVVLYNVASNYYKNSKFDEALKYYQKAVELRPDFTDAIYQLGLAYTTMGNTAEAIKTFEGYLKIDADSPRAGQVRNFLEYLKKK
jgi:tetratricopeptide (TPR) repeat protein